MSEIGALDARERAAVVRLVDRVAHGCGAATTWYEPPLGGGGEAPQHADVVVSCAGGQSHVTDLASRAAKALIIVRPNPDRVGAGAKGAGFLELTRLLWEVGRVREHAYLVFPRAVEAMAAAKGQVVGPDVAHAPVGTLVRRTAHLHAFVVDTAPRTPQARRRLRIAGAPA